MNYQILFWLTLAAALVSIAYPWNPTWPQARRLVHLPWLVAALAIRYESLVPREWNIRVDLLLLVPVLALVFTLYILRLGLFRVWRREQTVPQTRV